MEESTQRIVHEAIQQDVPVIVTDIIKRDVPDIVTDIINRDVPDIVTDIIKRDVPGIVTSIVTDIIKRDVPDIVTDIVKRDVPDIVTDIVTDIVDDSIHDSENLLLQEMERMEQRLGDRISSVEQSVQELKEYYYIARLDHDALDMVSRTVADHSERIAALEQKTA